MLNSFANGSAYNEAYPKPLNEDYSVVGKIQDFILSYEGSIVVFSKVWDKSEKLLYAKPLIFAEYEYYPIIVLDQFFTIGEYSVFYRTGDFNSQGAHGFELHNKDANKASWLVFTSNFR